MSEKTTIAVTPEEFQARVVAQEQAKQEADIIENDRRQAEYEAAQKRAEAREEFRIEAIKQQLALMDRQTALMQMQNALGERIAAVLERVAKKWA